MSDTLPRMVLRQAQRLASRSALRRKAGGAYRDISWAEMGENIRLFGRGLLALGLERGDRVAIMAANGPEWAYADLGAMACGALSVPVYHTEGENAVLHILKDSGSRFLFLQVSQAEEALLGRLAEVGSLQTVILLDEDNPPGNTLSLAEFRRVGEKTPPEILEAELAKGEGGGCGHPGLHLGDDGHPQGSHPQPRQFSLQYRRLPSALRHRYRRREPLLSPPLPRLREDGRVLPHAPPGRDHRLRGELRFGSRQPAGGRADGGHQRPAPLREDVRPGHGTGPLRALAEKADSFSAPSKPAKPSCARSSKARSPGRSSNASFPLPARRSSPGCASPSAAGCVSSSPAAPP